MNQAAAGVGMVEVKGDIRVLYGREANSRK